MACGDRASATIRRGAETAFDVVMTGVPIMTNCKDCDMLIKQSIHSTGEFITESVLNWHESLDCTH